MIEFWRRAHEACGCGAAAPPARVGGVWVYSSSPCIPLKNACAHAAAMPPRARPPARSFGCG